MNSETVQSATAFSGLMIQEPFSLDTAIFKGILMLLLSTFMAVSAISFLRFRLQRKEADFQRLVQLLGIEQSEAQFSVRRVSEEYAGRDYWLPVTFSTIVCLGGFFAVFFGADLVSLNVGRANMLLTGVFERSTKIEMQALRWQSQLVMSVAFLGAFVFSAQRIIRRLITGDLTPNVYYSVAIRMIFASIIALLLSLFLEASPIQDYSRETLPVVAFLVGVTPENALVFLREKFGFLMNKGAKQAHDLPLDMIEGMNMFYKLRVAEVGIDNAQNLAEANLIELLLKTPISAGNLIDWIAQARLYVYLKDDVESLRKLGDNLSEVKPNFLLGVPARMASPPSTAPTPRTEISSATPSPAPVRASRTPFG